MKKQIRRHSNFHFTSSGGDTSDAFVSARDRLMQWLQPLPADCSIEIADEYDVITASWFVEETDAEYAARIAVEARRLDDLEREVKYTESRIRSSENDLVRLKAEAARAREAFDAMQKSTKE